jgi:ABC-type multidrug transport system fused ATPase/permease subunit
MLEKLSNWIFGCSFDTLTFVLDERKRLIRRLLIIVPITFWGTLLGMLSPLFAKYQVDILSKQWTGVNILGNSFLQSSDLVKLLAIAVGTMLFVEIFDVLIRWLTDRVIFSLKQESGVYFEDRLTKFLQKFDASFLGAQNNVRIIRSIQYEIGSIQEDLLSVVRYMVEIPVTFVSILFIIPILDWRLVLTIFAVAAITLTIDKFKADRFRNWQLIETRQAQVSNSMRWDLINFFSRFVQNGLIATIYPRYQKERAKTLELQKSQWYGDYNLGLVSSIISTTGNSVSNLVAGFLVLAGKITIGTFSVFFVYIGRLKNAFLSIADLLRNLTELRLTLTRIEFITHLKPKLDYSNILPYTKKNFTQLEIKNLSFTYPAFFQEELEYLNKMKERLGLGENQKSKAHPFYQRRLTKEIRELSEMMENAKSNEEILTKLNYKFEKGKIYGLIGYNGAGKTTLTKLFKRSLDPAKGDIFIDDRNLKTIDPMTWRQQLSAMEQTSILLDGITVRDMLSLGCSYKPTDKQLWAVLKKVTLEKTVTDLDAKIAEGVEFSGGQKQLLELAQILLDPKPLIILDEGTNQLDAEKEQLIFDEISKIKQNSVIIFITHRATMSRKCDEIIVLEKGQIINFGNPNKLINSKSDNLFKKFWNIQIGNSSQIKTKTSK